MISCATYAAAICEVHRLLALASARRGRAPHNAAPFSVCTSKVTIADAQIECTPPLLHPSLQHAAASGPSKPCVKGLATAWHSGWRRWTSAASAVAGPTPSAPLPSLCACRRPLVTHFAHSSSTVRRLAVQPVHEALRWVMHASAVTGRDMLLERTWGGRAQGRTCTGWGSCA